MMKTMLLIPITFVFAFAFLFTSNSNTHNNMQHQGDACVISSTITCGIASWPHCGVGPGCNYQGPSGRW